MLNSSPISFSRKPQTYLGPAFAISLAFSLIFCPSRAEEEISFNRDSFSWLNQASATGSIVSGNNGEGATGLQLLSPIHWDGSNFLFFAPNFQARESGQTDVSLGLGFRSLVNNQFIFGANAFYDSTESTNGGNFGQFGFGAEFLTERFRARTNFHIPDGRRGISDSDRVNRTLNSTNIIGDTNPNVSDPFATGYGIFADTVIDYEIENVVRNESYLFQKFEEGMQGQEFEAGILAPIVDQFGDIWIYGGYYHFNNPFAGTVSGPMARAEVQLTEHVIFDAAWFDDAAVSTVASNWTFGIRASIPIGKRVGRDPETRGIINGIGRFLSGQNPLPRRTLESQITQDIIRNSRVRLAESNFIENVDARVIDEQRTSRRVFSNSRDQETAILPGVSAPGFLDIIFVDINAPAGGDGTAEAPYQNIMSAQLLADTRFAALGRTQGIYVQSRTAAYTDNITFSSPGSRFALADTSITLPLASGRTFGGGTTAATWTPATGAALNVDSVGQFSFGGFNISTASGPAPAVSIRNMAGPPLPPPAGVIPTEAFHFLGGTTLESTGGPALTIDDTGVSGSIASLKSTASASQGVAISNMTGALSVEGNVMVTDSTLDGIAIINTSGNFSVLGTSILENLFSLQGSDGIDIQDSSGTFTFALVDIDGWEDGTDFEDNNTAQIIIRGGSIDGTIENGVELVDSNLAISNVTFGAGAQIGNDAVNFEGFTGTTTSSFTDLTIADAFDEGFEIDTFGGDHRFAFNRINIEMVDETGILIEGFGGGTLTVTDFRDITIESPNVGGFIGSDGAIFIDTVTFDANPNTVAIEQVSGGDLSIGTLASRANGFGMTMFDPSGNLAFNDISIFNDGDFGLFVNTKLGGTTFTLGGTGGTVDTINAPALFLDPLTVDLTFQSVNSDGSFDNGILLDEMAGTLDIASVSITNTDANGFEMFNSSAAVTIGDIVLDTIGAENTGILLDTNTGSLTITGDATISNVSDSIESIDSNIEIQGLTSTSNIFSAISITGSGNASFGDVSISDSQLGVSLRDTSGAIKLGNITTGVIGDPGSGGFLGMRIRNQTGGSVEISSLSIFESTRWGFVGDNNAGTVTVTGDTAISSDVFGMAISGAEGNYTFQGIDISMVGASTGIDFDGSLSQFQSSGVSITGDSTAGSIGVNLTDTQAGSVIRLGDTINSLTDAGSSISAVEFGVRITNSNANFIFGDGEMINDTGSSNGAITPIDGAGGTGTFNFDDVP